MSIPDSYELAMVIAEAKEWMPAMEDEMASFKEKGAFELVDNSGKKRVRLKWVFTL